MRTATLPPPKRMPEIQVSDSQITFSRKHISPRVAQEYLKNNPSNRKVKERVVNRYAKEMAAGRWKEDTGETIKISKSGRVIDGQHRLMAVIKSGVSLYFHFVSNVDDSAFEVIDTGTIRNAPDVFSIERIKNAAIIPAIISSYLIMRDNGTFRADQSIKPTHSVLLEEYNSRPRYWQAVCNQTQSWYNAFAKILTPSMIGGVFSVLRDINEPDAEEFFRQLSTGSAITNNTIAVLRNKLMTDKMSSGSKLTIPAKVALIIKTWNCFRKGKEISYLKYDPAREDYPAAI